jgi:hemolysin D
MSSVEASPAIVPKQGGSRWSREDTARQFLPAALEILETPASPVGRAIGGLIILFFAIAIVWATFGHVDIIATAQGKIVPTGRTKTIQPLEPGIVAAIHVQDGDEVTAGQVLIELDRTVTQAERKHVASDLMASQLDVARLVALRDNFELSTIPTISRCPRAPRRPMSPGPDRRCGRRPVSK